MFSIAKGNRVVVPFLAVNQSKKIWGEDALEFRCDVPLPYALIMLIALQTREVE